jgi:N-hydroxyarylamine O-acetyltransferase
MTPEQVDRYLQRIGYVGPRQPGPETLAALQRAHMLTVPFEALDIARGAPLVLDVERTFEKVVDRRRGGWCFELNGLFAELLRELGFRVTLLGARIVDEEGVETPDEAHLLLRVDLDPPMVADVGFGESSIEPLPLPESGELENGGLLLRFDGEPRRLSDFAGPCARLQTSPESPFVRNRICSLATPEGRITLSDRRFIETRDGERVERELDEPEYERVLAERFGIVLAG